MKKKLNNDFDLPSQDLSRLELKLLTDHLPIIMWIVDSEGNTIYVNQKWKDYTGIKVEKKFNESDWMTLIHPDDQERSGDLWRQCIHKGNDFELEMRLKRASDESFRWQIVRVAGLKDKMGRLIKWYGTATDIHEWKEDKEKVVNSEALLKEAQETAHVGNWELSLITNKIIFSEEMYRIFGFNREEFDHTFDHILTFIHPHDQKRVIDFLDCIRAGERLDKITVRIIRSDGVIRFLSVGVKFIFDIKGDLIAIRGVALDVTEFEERGRFIQHISDASPCFILLYDINIGNYIYFNNEILNQLGYSHDQVKAMGHLILNSIHPEDQVKHWEARHNWDGFSDEDIKHIEYRIKDSGGKWLWVASRLKIFQRDMYGNVLQIISSAQNVTYSKKLEEEAMELKLSKQKEIANAILHAQEGERERIGEALHNGLGQLLFAIKLHFQQYKLKIGDVSNDEINPLIHEAIEQAKKISFELMPGILKDFGLEVALKEFTKKIDRDFNFEFEFSGLEDRLSDYYEIAIFRIIQELTNNVVKYAKVKEAKVKLSKTGQVITIIVEDQGVGFEVEKINNNFGSTGLQNIKNRVNLLNGKFKIISTHGKGTTAFVDIDLRNSMDLKNEIQSN